MTSRDSTVRQMNATSTTTASTSVNAVPSLSLISQTGSLQPDALLSVGNVVSTSSAAFSSADLLDALSDRTVSQSTSASSDLLPDVGLLHLTTLSSSSSATASAAGNQQALLGGLSSTSSQPLVPSTADYSAFSADALLDVDYQSVYSSNNA